MNRHTPEPWGVWLNPDGCNRGMITDDALARHIVYVVGNTHEAKANGRRIVACVNACAGINPEAVPKLLEALKWAMKQGNLGYATRTKGNTAYCDAVDRAVAVIAKAEDNG